jgi:hypothetical protein
VTVKQVLRKVGSWSIRVRADAPAGVISALTPFGHVAVVPGRVNPVEHGDDILTMARYVGVYRGREHSSGGQITLSGVGVEAWLGDEDAKGDCIESLGVTATDATFVEAIRALLPTHGSITEGTLHAGVSGTITAVWKFTAPRTAIDYVCDTMGGEWRVNGNGTLDAGPATSLFRMTPTCVIARREVAGRDLTLKAVPGNLTTSVDAKDLTTRILIVGQGLATGAANADPTGWVDLHGNAIQVTRIVDETSDTSGGNAATRALATLNLWKNPRKSLRLSVAEFDIAGDLTPGDLAWVWDPDNGLVDTTYEQTFRGRLINPVPVRVLSLSWPVTQGYTVAYRSSDGNGTWTDLTPWIEWEAPGGGEVEVADTLSAALTSALGGTSVPASGGGNGDPAVPGVPTLGTLASSIYQPSDGGTRALLSVPWTEPTNTDGTTIVDGARYELRYRPTGATDWQTLTAPWDSDTTTIYELAPATSVDVQIRAVDYATPPNYGAWSATTTAVTAADAATPDTPAAPTVAASLIAVQVTHDLTNASSGNLPDDLDHLEVHAGASAEFTPDTSTRLGKLAANAGMIAAGIPAVGTFGVSATTTVYVKVIAVDRAGNQSSASTAASSTATLIDDAHISDLTVTKVTAGTLSAAVILAGSIKTATSGARVEIDSSGVRAYNSGGTETVDISSTTGLFTLRSAASGARVEIDSSGVRAYNSGGTETVDINADGTAVITGTVQTGLTGSRILIDPDPPSGVPTVFFYRPTGDPGWINSYTDGAIEASAASNGTTRTRLQVSQTIAQLQCITTGDAHYGGHLRVDDTAGYLEAYTSGAAMRGQVVVNQTSASIGYSGAAKATFTAEDVHAENGGGEWLWMDGSAGTTTISGGSTTVQAGGAIEILGGSVYIQSGNPMRLRGAGSTMTIWIGDDTTNDHIASLSLYNTTNAGAANVYIAASGQLYRSTSSAVYKTSIHPLAVDPLSVLALEPKSWTDRGELDRAGGDPTGLPVHAGLIAEDVADIPGLEWLVDRDSDGYPDAVHYPRVAVALIPVVRELWARVVGSPPPAEDRTRYDHPPQKLHRLNTAAAARRPRQQRNREDR